MSESMEEKHRRLVAGWKQQQARVRDAEAALQTADQQYKSAVEAGDLREMSQAARRRAAAGGALHTAQVQEAVARSLAGDPWDDLPVEDREDALLRQRRLAEEVVLQAEQEVEAAERRMNKALRRGDIVRGVAAGKERAVKSQALHRAYVALHVVRRTMGDD